MKKLVKLLDGGFGTTLRDHFNIKNNIIWSLDPIVNNNYDITRKCHELFIKAGSDIIITSNYCSTPYYLKKIGKTTEHQKLYTKVAGEIAKDLQSEYTHIKVAGSIPPYGESYRTTENISEIDLLEHYTITIDSLKDSVDFFIAETITSIREFKLILRSISTIKCFIYFSFCIKEDGLTLYDGTSINNVINIIKNNSNKIKGILFNCSPINCIDKAIYHIKENLVDYPHLEFGCYPNKHTVIPEKFNLQTNNKIQYRNITPEEYLIYSKKWIDLGATIIGGCCGIGPTYISYLKKKNYNK